jgi:hypothetical protein
MADQIILVTIYAKTEQSDISPEGIRELIEEILGDQETNGDEDDPST